MIRWIFLSTCLLLSACKKKDEQPPVVKIVSPGSLSTYAYQSTIIVEASAEDESKLEHVDLELLDGNLSLLQSRRFKVEGKTYDLSAGFDLDDIHYETGQYYIRVRAYDGTNETSEYLEFSYQGVAKQLLDVLYVEQNGGQFSVKSLNDGTIVSSIGSDFFDIQVNSYDQYLYTSGTQTEDLVAFDLEEMGEIWRRQNMSSGNDWFVGMNYFPESRELYYGNGDGSKFLVSKNGQSNTVASPVTSFLPEESGRTGNYLIVDEKNLSTGNHSLMVYNEVSGALSQSAVISYDVIAIYPKSNDEVFVFGHDGTQIRMSVYFLNTNALWEPYTFGNAGLNDVIQFDTDRFALLTNQGIEVYTHSSNGAINVSTLVFKTGKYCTTTNSLFLLNSSEITEMGLSGNVIQTSSITGGVDLDLRYNK